MNYVNQEIFGEFPYDIWGLTLKFKSCCFQSQCCPWENSGLILLEGERMHVAAWPTLANQMSVPEGSFSALSFTGFLLCPPIASLLALALIGFPQFRATEVHWPPGPELTGWRANHGQVEPSPGLGSTLLSPVQCFFPESRSCLLRDSSQRSHLLLGFSLFLKAGQNPV